MDDNDLIRLDRQLCFMLYAGSRAMTRAYQPMLRQLQLTYPQYLVLMVLWEWAAQPSVEATVTALGARLQLDSGTLTPLLKRLEQRRLVSRSRDPRDERRVLVSATAAGRALESQAAAWRQNAGTDQSLEGVNVQRLREELAALLAALSA